MNASKKRQRRQGAASLVQSALGGGSNTTTTNSGRKSTAQPRPTVHIPPRGIGPIVDPNANDVLCGRGGRINSHPGNVQFRDIVQARKKDYLSPATKKLEKAHIAAKIVQDIRSMEPNGRFLKEDRDTGLWFDIGDAKAIKKAGQALREDAPDIRQELGGDSSGDEKKGGDEKKATKKVEKAKSPKAAEKSESAGTSSKSKSSSSSSSAKSKTKPQKASTENLPDEAGFRQTSNQPGNSTNNNNNSNNNNVPAQQIQTQIAVQLPYEHQILPFAPSGQPFQNSDMPQYQSSMQPPNPMQPGFTQSRPQGTGYSFSNNFFSSGQSVGGGGAPRSSRQATEMLAQPEQHPDGMDQEAFGRVFHPPNSVFSAGNTMSDISGLSDNVSSTFGMDTGSGMGLPPGYSPSFNSRKGINSSLRSGQIRRIPSNRSSDVGGSVKSFGSINRSTSFPDINSIGDQSSWKAIMEGDEDLSSDIIKQALLSDASVSLASRNSMFGTGASGSFRNSLRNNYPPASGGASVMSMSIASMSIGSGNSAQWLGPTEPTQGGADDGRSVFSDMSSDLHALDLAF